MDKWGTIHVAHIPRERAREHQEIGRQCFPIYEKFKGYRSEVIEAALFIESRLDVLLCVVFAGLDHNRQERFRTLVLQPESCSFTQKWKMLRGALSMKGIPSAFPNDDDRKSFLSALKQLISDRNQFAHGVLFIDARDDRPFIKYYEDGEKNRYLSEDLMHGIIGSARLILDQIEGLIRVAEKQNAP